MTLITIEQKGKNRFVMTADKNVIGGYSMITQQNKILKLKRNGYPVYIATSGDYISTDIMESIYGSYYLQDKFPVINAENIRGFYKYINTINPFKDLIMAVVTKNEQFIYTGKITETLSETGFLSIGSGAIFAKSIYEYLKEEGKEIDYKKLYSTINSKLDLTVSKEHTFERPIF